MRKNYIILKVQKLLIIQKKYIYIYYIYMTLNFICINIILKK